MQMQTPDLLVSPRMRALNQELESGNNEALDLFWQNMTREGTPLIESIPGDEKHSFVTFLWRADEPVDHVVLYSEFLRGMWWNNWADALLHKLHGTSLYYRTYKIRNDMRFVYWLSPNHPLIHVRDVKDWDIFMAHCQVDPLNPRVFLQDKDRSYVEMPSAPPQPWHVFNEAVPCGKLEHFDWHSQSLENDRQVWVYTPEGYIEHKPYSLLLLLDGGIFTKEVPAPTIFDNLVTAGATPPFVAVMLDSPARQREFYCDEPFTTCVIQEILPWVRQNYHVTTDPQYSVIGGVSAGGLAAAFMGLHHSDVFGNVLSCSGAFWWSPQQDSKNFWYWEIPPEGEWLIRQYANHEKISLRFHLDAGLLEDQRDNATPTLLQANRHFRDVLQAKGYWVHYSEFCGGHQYINFRGTLPEGLIALLGDNMIHSD